jgi:hypothetical protein
MFSCLATSGRCFRSCRIKIPWSREEITAISAAGQVLPDETDGIETIHGAGLLKLICDLHIQRPMMVNPSFHICRAVMWQQKQCCPVCNLAEIM